MLVDYFSKGYDEFVKLHSHLSYRSLEKLLLLWVQLIKITIFFPPNFLAQKSLFIIQGEFADFSLRAGWEQLLRGELW